MASEGLKKWFGRNQGRGWVDCKAAKAAGKFVPCGRSSAKKSRKTGYPACRPTMSACTSAACAVRNHLNGYLGKNK